MRALILIAGAFLALSSCDGPGGEAPADNSPVAPEVVCEEPQQMDNDSAMECAEPENEVADFNIGDSVTPPEKPERSLR
jgi:hypothetical protein